jgi:hypothetical protein
LSLVESWLASQTCSTVDPHPTTTHHHPPPPTTTNTTGNQTKQPGTVRSIDVRKFGGTAWEEAYASTGISACTPAKSGGGTGGGGGGSGGGAV